MKDKFHQRPQDVTTFRDPGYAGQPLKGDASEGKDAINASPALAHKVRLTPTPAAGGETFGFTLTQSGESITFSATVAASDNTAAEVTAALKTAIEADAELLSCVYPVDNAGTLDLVAYVPGTDSAFTLASLVGNLAQSTQATGADAVEIPFGRAVVALDSFSSGSAFAAKQARALSDEICALPSSSTLPAKSIAFAFGGTFTNTDVFIVQGSVKYNGLAIPVSASANDSTLDAVGAALETYIDALSLSMIAATYNSSTNVLTVAASIPGVEFDLHIAIAGTSTVTRTATNEGSFLDAKMLGIARYTHDTDSDVLGQFATAYKPGEGVKIVSRGAVWVEVAGGSPAAGGTVYVGTASGEEGKLFAASGAGRCPLSPAKAVWRKASGSFGLIELL
jgi:hypothetical protein